LRLDEQEERSYQTELDRLAPEEKERVMEVRMSWRERDRLEALQEGHQEGLQEGLKEGLQRGRKRLAAVITHQIERRLGPISVALGEQISELSEDQLERLGDELLDFATVEDLTRWLEQL